MNESEKTNTELLIETIQSITDAKLVKIDDEIFSSINHGLNLRQLTTLYVSPVKESYDPSVLNELQSRIYESFYNKSEESKTRNWNMGDFKRARIYSCREGFFKKKETSKELHFGNFEIYELLGIDLNVTYDITINDTYLCGMTEKINEKWSSNGGVHGNNIQPKTVHYNSLQQGPNNWLSHAQFNRCTKTWIMPSEEFVKNMVEDKIDKGSDYSYFADFPYSIDLLNKDG